MIVLDAVLMVGITAAIVGLLIWSVCTQYRDAGCAHLRIRRRSRISARDVRPDEPQAVRRSRVALSVE
jgi:hypothetical protein